MTVPLTYAENIMSELVPKIRNGIAGGVHLTARECEDLLRVLSVSVTVETLMEHCAGLLRKTLSRSGEETDNESEKDGSPTG